MSAMHTLVSTYPGKAVWTLIAIAINAIRLPYWLLWYIPASNRPNKNWTHRQAVAVAILREVLVNMSFVEMKTPLSLKPGSEKKRFVVVNPAKEAYYVDAVSSDPEVRPDRVGITWWPRVPSASEGTGTVILHFHGGAYAIGDGRTQDAGFAAKTMVDNSDATHVACPQYRLASNPGGRFPAALQDAVTCYAHLVFDLGISPKKIVLSGDSAGANLALALTRYIEHHGKLSGLPKPAATLLWSCWANPGALIKLGWRVMDESPNIGTDYITAGFGMWGATKMMPSKTSGHTIESDYISFVGNAFKTDVPLYLSIGESEVLYHDCIQLAEEFSAIKGNQVKVQVEENCPHDTILVGRILGFEKEAVQSVKRVNIWLREIMGSSSTKL